MAMTEGRRLSGVAAAPGVARGPWARVRRRELPAGGRVTGEAVGAEQARLRAAADHAADDLMALSERVGAAGHEDEAAIFMAHAAMAWDPALIDVATARIGDQHEDGVAAIQAAGASVAAMLAALDDEILSARSADVIDVADRIARLLAGLPVEEALLPAPAVVVADDLSPSLTATLPRENILGIVLEAGSPTAHAAILARAYGIPAVVGTNGILAALEAAGPDVELALDGTTGEVLIAPDAAAVAELDARAARLAKAREADRGEASLPAVTRDGVEVTLLANIGTPGEAAPARALGARGVGLFRTEFLFLERSTPPGEDEQTASYREAVEAFEGDPVTIRLLDIGGDKPIPYLPMPAEDNPFLGVRALRLAADRPEIFVTQLRACYRAAVAGPVKVMAPMVADGGDASLLLDLAARARDGLAADGIAVGTIDLGVMLEIPSAILSADCVVRRDRVRQPRHERPDAVRAGGGSRQPGPRALPRCDAPGGPAADPRWRRSRAARAGIPLSVCGEMGGDPAAALALVGPGRPVAAAWARRPCRPCGVRSAPRPPGSSRDLAHGRPRGPVRGRGPGAVHERCWRPAEPIR